MIIESSTFDDCWFGVDELAVEEETVDGGGGELLIQLPGEDEEQDAEEDDGYFSCLAFGLRRSAACCNSSHHRLYCVRGFVGVVGELDVGNIDGVLEVRSLEDVGGWMDDGGVQG
jgi:hypothetical protein